MLRLTLPRLATLALSGALAACSGSDPVDPPVGTAGTNAGGDSAGSGGSETGGTETGGGGSSTAGTEAGGSSTAGTFNQGGNGGSGGTFGTAGTAAGGGGAGGVSGGGGGAGGAGGAAVGGGGAGGMGGAGGAPTEAQVCQGTGWNASALVSTDPPSNAIDRDADRNQSRFSTGRPMAVGDWLQVDFGRTLTVDDVSIRWGANDYAGQFDVRLSDTALAHQSEATVAGFMGAAGTQKVDLPYQAKGRYLLITLKAVSSTNWWSIQDVFVTCGDGMMGGGGGGAGGGGAGGNGGAGGTATGGGGAGGTATGGGGAGGTATGGGGAGGTDPGTGGTTTGGTDPGTGGTTTGGTDPGTGGTAGTGTGGTGTEPECVTAADCANENFCLDVACNAGQCVTTPNSAECPDDNNPCTDDVCSQGSCGEDTGICVGSDLVLIRVNRPQTNQHVFVNPADGILKSTGTAALATIFQREFLNGTKHQFRLKEAETGQYVGIGANERMFANADATTAMIFGAPDCTTPFVGLYAYGDDDNARAVTAEANEFLEATRGACDPGNAGSWEKFQLLPVLPGCKADVDCDDGNPCTAETCNAGHCAFVDEPPTTTCADDGNACTADICMGGLCVHENNVIGGECGTSLVTIRANRDAKNYITLNEVGNFLEWNAPLLENAGLFEMVDRVGTQFKLRAENGMFVRVTTLGATPDELVADGSYLEAGIFDNAACGTKQSFRLVTDVDDANRYVKTDNIHLRAINADCGAGTTSWEQFEFTPVAQP